MTSAQAHLILPLVAMALLTFAVLFTMGAMRYNAGRKREVDASYYELYRGNAEPDQIRQLSRNFSNLFETPVLFYLAVVIGLIINLDTNIFLGLSWLFVAMRYLHSYIHCTSNKVMLRFKIYIVSCLNLIALWGVLLAEVLSAL